jgi:hypothetical protein
MGHILAVECVIIRFRVIENRIVIVWKRSKSKSFCTRAFPDYLRVKLVCTKDLVEHDFDIVGGVPVAVVVEGAGEFEDAVEFDAAGPHEFDIGLGGGVAVIEGAFFFGFAPEDLVVAIGIERRVDVDEVHAMVGELFELVEVVAAVDDAGIDEGRRPARGGGRGWRRVFGFFGHGGIVAESGGKGGKVGLKLAGFRGNVQSSVNSEPYSIVADNCTILPEYVKKFSGYQKEVSRLNWACYGGTYHGNIIYR